MKARPFVLLGVPRCGSTLLANALADHPDVLMYGELFHDLPRRRADEAARRTLGNGLPREATFGMPACGDADDGATYIARVLRQGTSARRIGFKLFTHHARRGAVASLWHWLATLEDLTVIDLRRDLVACAVSEARAWATDRWHATEVIHPPPVQVVPEACEAFLRRCLEHEPLVAPLRARPGTVRVDYADLERDFAGTFATVQAALGLTPRTIAPRLRKISERPLREDVANWQELIAYLRVSPIANALLLDSAAHD